MKHILFILFSLFALCAHAQVSQQDYGEEAGGGGGFVDPTSVTSATLKLWLDGNDVDGDGSIEGLSESTVSSGEVVDWKDKSGNGLDFSQHNGSPQLQDNGDGTWAVAGDGNDNLITDDVKSEWTWMNDDNDMTLFIMLEIDNVNSGAQYLLMSNLAPSPPYTAVHISWRDDGSFDKDLGVIYWANQPVGGAGDVSLNHRIESGGDFTSSNTYYSCMIMTDFSEPYSTRLESEIDGTSLTVTDIGANEEAVNIAPTGDMRILSHGRDQNYLVGSIKQIVGFDGRLSAAETAEMFTWLATQ